MASLIWCYIMLYFTHFSSSTTHIQYIYMYWVFKRKIVARKLKQVRVQSTLVLIFHSCQEMKSSCDWHVMFGKLVSVDFILLTWQFVNWVILAAPVYLWDLYEDVSYNGGPEVSLTVCFIDCWWHFISWVLNLCTWQKSGSVTGAAVLQLKRLSAVI